MNRIMAMKLFIRSLQEGEVLNTPRRAPAEPLFA